MRRKKDGGTGIRGLDLTNGMRGPLEVFETGEERFKKTQAATKSTNKKKKT